MKQQKKKLKGVSPLNLDVCPMRRMEKLLKYSSVRQTDYSLLVKLQSLRKKQIQNKTVYMLDEPEGAYLVKSFLQPHQQLAIAQEALNSFVEEPYRTNLSGQKGLYDSHSQEEPQVLKHLQHSPNNGRAPEPILQPPHNQLPVYHFDERIRWANLGFNYDWTNRKYPSTKTLMPQSVAKLAANANQLYSELVQLTNPYTAESAIVNYYKERDTMTSHLDDAEPDQTQPIFSFSIGLSCVFLIGGQTKDTQPTAMRLDSGDMFIMAERSRKCYHGVPRVIAGTFQIEKYEEVHTQMGARVSKPNDQKQTLAYLKTHRININIRQVYSPPEKLTK